MRNAAQTYEITSQRRNRTKCAGECLAGGSRCQNHPPRQTPRARQTPNAGGSVEKLLNGDRLLIAQTVSAADSFVHHRRGGRVEEIVNLKEVVARGLTPHAEQAQSRQPPGRFHHQNAFPLRPSLSARPRGLFGCRVCARTGCALPRGAFARGPRSAGRRGVPWPDVPLSSAPPHGGKKSG